MTIFDVSYRWSTRHQNEDLVTDHHHFHKKRSCDVLVADQHFHQVEQQGNGSNGAVFQQSEETKDSDGLPHPKVGGQSFQGIWWNIDAEMCRFIYFQVSYDDDKFQISLDAKNYKWDFLREKNVPVDRFLFSPEELDVKVEGSTIVITAKQEVR